MWKGWKEEVGQQEWRAFMAGQTCLCGWWEIAGECPDWIVGVWVGPRGCVYTGVYTVNVNALCIQVWCVRIAQRLLCHDKTTVEEVDLPNNGRNTKLCW